MPYPRDLSPKEQLELANKVAPLALAGSVDPVDILITVGLPRGRFNLTQAPNVVWREIIQGLNAGMSQTAGSGCEALANLLETLASDGFLPGRVELRDMAFQLAHDQKAPSATGKATGPVQRLFLSYSSLDRPDVDRLHDALKAMCPTLEIFQDHRMPPGTRWYDAINNAATAASKMVCWTTENYLKSPFCAFEIGLVTTAGTALIPVFAPPELKTKPLPAYLSPFQGIDGKAPLDIPHIAQAIIAALN